MLRAWLHNLPAAEGNAPVTRPNAPVRVCFVCLGNICRSPTAEGVFRHLVTEAGLADRFEIDSAGMTDYHVGEPPDHRARAAGRRAGIVIDGAARAFSRGDFARFDHVIAMDSSNVRDLGFMAPSPEAALKIRLFRSFDPQAEKDAPVPDPYYGDAAGFDHVLELCRSAGQHLLEEIRRERAF